MNGYLIAAVVFAAAAAALCAALILRKKRLAALRTALDAYLRDGTPLPFSLREGDAAQLQNEICELAARLEREKQKTKEVERKNAEFAADVSHQLKTPLAGLRLYCELEAENGSETAMKELRLIEKTERLTAELLKLQKIRADSFDFSFEGTPLAALIREKIASFQPLWPEKRFTVDGSASLRCDRAWLGEAISNIIKNACEHTDAAGSVAARLEETEETVTLTIEDDGGGVPAEELPHLFERFYKAKNASPDSTGLGLAITREIVSKHHGTVAAENTEKGLRLTLCFPKIDANIKIDV